MTPTQKTLFSIAIVAIFASYAAQVIIATAESAYRQPAAVVSSHPVLPNPNIYKINILSPKGGEKWAIGTTHNVLWSSNLASTSRVRITLYKPDGVSYNNISTDMANTGQFSWYICDRVPADGYTLKVDSNTYGNIKSQTTQPFTITAAPSGTSKLRPDAPSKLTVTDLGGGSVTLNWKDNSNNESGFWIRRSSNADGTNATGSDPIIARLDGNVTEYKDTGLKPGQHVFYRVRAAAACGLTTTSTSSVWSNQVPITIK